MSSPLAATSVAIRTWKRLFLKLLIVLSLLAWGISPCRVPTFILWYISSASVSTIFLVWQNTTVFGHPFVRIDSSLSILAPLDIGTQYWVTRSETGSSLDTLISIGSCILLNAMRFMLSAMVAEKRRVCLSFGTASIMKSSSSANPISSMRSASSSTTSVISERSSAPRVIISLSLPGVPTTMSTPFLSP